MSPVARPYWLALVFGLTPLVEAQSTHPQTLMLAHGGHGHGGGTMGGGFGGGVPGGFLASGIVNHPGHQRPGPGLNYGYGYGNGFGYGVGYGYSSVYGYGTPFLTGNVGVPLIWPVFVPTNFGNGGGGLMLPLPPQQVANNAAPAANAGPRHRNTNRTKELVEIGDRSFRGGNIKRAEEKYHLAAKADPTSPVPHVHLAQVSLARGDYSAAADHLRDAVTVSADGGWILNAPDIQAIYAEPADFAKHLARLESHLQANPTDRDAWFVLGVECYLSGRSKQASDVFQRLTDRKPDEALAAFLDASKSKLPAPAN